MNLKAACRISQTLQIQCELKRKMSQTLSFSSRTESDKNSQNRGKKRSWIKNAPIVNWMMMVNKGCLLSRDGQMMVNDVGHRVLNGEWLLLGRIHSHSGLVCLSSLEHVDSPQWSLSVTTWVNRREVFYQAIRRPDHHRLGPTFASNCHDQLGKHAHVIMMMIFFTFIITIKSPTTNINHIVFIHTK